MRFLRVMLLLPFSIVYLLLVEIRRLIYHFAAKTKVTAKVISVGNITSGGTGKTPVVMSLLELLKHKNVAVVSRSYKLPLKSPKRVDAKHPEVFGDEACLLAAKFPHVPIFSGPVKSKTALFAQSQVNPDVIVVDDGFQHLKLHRDVDILVVDATQPKWNYWPLPSGYARDGFWRLSQAHVVIASKWNLASQSQKTWLSSILEKDFVELNYSIQEFYNPAQDVVVENPKSYQRVALLSAIGRPESFETLVRPHVGEIKSHIQLDDHHSYSLEEISRIAKLCSEYDAVLTTEKDFVKITQLEAKIPNLIVVKLKVEAQNLAEKLSVYI